MKLKMPLRKARALASSLATRIRMFDALIASGAAGFDMIEAGALDLCGSEAEADALAASAVAAREEMPRLVAARHAGAGVLADLIRDEPEACSVVLGEATPFRVARVGGFDLPFFPPPPGVKGLPWPSAEALFAILGLDQAVWHELDIPDVFFAITEDRVVCILSPDTAEASIKLALRHGTMSADTAFELGLLASATEA